MGESLLQVRHPELDRLYAIWKLLRLDDNSPPASAADPDLLREWQDHLVIVEADKATGALRELHIGVAVVSSIVSNDTIKAAITGFSNSQQPILLEDSIEQSERYTALLLPFSCAYDGAIRVIAAVYRASQLSSN